MGFALIENHDIPRVVSTWGNYKEYLTECAKAFGAIYFLQKGTPFIYQGQELGMTNVKYHSICEYDDVKTINTYNERIESGVSEEIALKEAFRESLAALGGHLDILVTAHGVQSRHPSEEFPMEDWKRVLDVNLTAVFELCQLAAKQFMVQESKGKIITVASMLSFFGGYTVPAYAASKGGVSQITKAFCNEWAEKGINVNSIAPGYMATEMNTALLDPDNPRKEAITNRIPAKRWGTAEDMKGPCVFLASDASDYLNGAVIPVDGGYLVR